VDATVTKIALAALLHDIGKLADREALHVTEKYLLDNASQYQPFDGKRHTHAHAIYTAAFLEAMQDVLPLELSLPHWGKGDSFINLAAGHHNPETPMQWVVTIADRISSGWDRNIVDTDYHDQVAPKEYKKTRLYPIFEQLRIEPQGDEAHQPLQPTYCYPLKELSPETIFPGLKAAIVPESSEAAGKQYLGLFAEFKEALGTLLHRTENMALWLEHFDSLMMIFTSSIPQARAGKIFPDVSLFDHSRTAAALAVAIYLYHSQTDSLTMEEVKNFDDNKFLIISGEFYGIQDFIFLGYGDTRKYRSKLLRGRSFAISLFTELAADLLCREIGLPITSIVLNAAGKFAVMAPNTQAAHQAVTAVEKWVNDWLFQISYGETAIGLSVKEASPQDFVKGNFADLWNELGKTMERKKYNRLGLDVYGGPVHSYLDSFNNDLEHPLCPLCGKRPASPQAEGTEYVKEVKSSCTICRDHIFLGSKLVKTTRLAILKPDVSLSEGNRLLEPVFGRYQVAFPESGLQEMAGSGQLLRLWDLGFNSGRQASPMAAVKFINGYVPVYTEPDLHDPRLTGPEKDERPLNQADLGSPKTLEDIAALALNPKDKEGKHCGLEALGILKADVDDLGLLLACGLKRQSFTISRLATLSRQLDFYFTVYLPHLLITDPRFENIYTVFAGGDDLFLIGPWNRTIELATLLKDTFAHYVCHNSQIHFSAGIALKKSHTPIDQLAATADAALKQAKGANPNEKNRLTLFEESASWGEVEELHNIKATLQDWFQQEWINPAMLYRLNELIGMAGEEKRVVKAGEIHLDDMACTKWRAYLAYTIERNGAPKVKGEQRTELNKAILAKTTQWLQVYGRKMRIPLWELLYDQR
jgi:CRISPR-associated protein Csm1